MTGVFLVDDHEMVRRAVAAVIDAATDLCVVGEAGSCREALRRIAATRPDVAVLDVHLPDGSGIELCRAVRREHPGCRCLILTGYDDAGGERAAAAAGADGLLLKTVRTADVAGAVRTIASGRPLPGSPGFAAGARRLDRTAQERRETREDAHPDPRIASLSLRERQVLALIADAQTNRQIAERMHLAEKTVKNYVTSLLSKLGFTHRTQAAVFASSRQRPLD
ncbi:response regulator transcription factor [Microbacterium sp. p3-SID336]|uniref:response regulator transcription factor n=1 Tax=Microbacterium sp. p3-SID336 TaxID=2916212 RepID=UPI0021A7EEF4|nr:response regulator transcription factor [Microbacterium sp. p3-SID336]MCT1478582.1 response regulator transcription factor [Microbacterium sp. p3-SID336]